MSQSEKNARALHDYIKRKNLPNIKYFYTELADKSEFHRIYGKTPLQNAVERCNLHVVELLVDLGADIYETYTEELPVQMYPEDESEFDEDFEEEFESELESIRKYLEQKNEENMNKFNENGNTPLTEAIKRKCLPAITYLISKGANLTLKGPNGITPLCAAIDTNDDNMIDKIVSELTHSADENVEEFTNSLLYAISKESDWKIVERLLNLGADCTHKDDSGNTTLIYALKTYGEKFSAYLIGNNYLEKVLKCAVESDDLETIRLFIKKSPNIIFSKDNVINKELADYFVDAMTKRGIPIDLFSIMSLNNSDLLRHCFKDPKSREINLKKLKKFDNKGETLLHIAINNNNLEMIKLLNQMGANVCKTNLNGDTPLDKAVIEHNMDIAKYLLENGAHFTARTALIKAIKRKNFEMVELLLKSIKDVNFRDIKTGNAPLKEALTQGNIRMVEALIKNNTNLLYEDSEGLTPLDISVKLGFNDATKLFIQHGVDPNSFLKLENETLLHKYMNDLDFDMTTFLIKHGADVKKIDKNNQCPLVKGLQMENGKLLSLLLEKGADPFCEHFKDNNLLSIAAAEEYFPVVDILLQKNPSVNGAVEEIKKFAEISENFAIYMKELNIECSGEPVVPSGIGHEAAFPTEKGDGDL